MDVYVELIDMLILGCVGMLAILLLFVIGCVLIASIRDFFDEFF